jgi:hypothetical protein
MFNAILYLVLGSAFLIAGFTGKGLRANLPPEKLKAGRKILTFCGALLLVGGLWELLEAIL